MEQKSEYVGTMACSLCGNVCGVKKSAKGRMTVVCKWQDGGCGSQLQTLTADSGMKLIQKMTPLAKQPEPEINTETLAGSEAPEAQPSPSPSQKTSTWGLV